MDKSANSIKVGVGLLVFKEGKILLGKRKGSHGSDEFGGPGGHAEYGETLIQTVERELEEECGIVIKDIRMLCVSDLTKYSPKQYVDIGFTAEWVSGEPQVLEPDKLESWDWYGLDELPENLFGCVNSYLESIKTGKNYFIVD
jgi:8-oxo-dGTP diphosphatase